MTNEERIEICNVLKQCEDQEFSRESIDHLHESRRNHDVVLSTAENWWCFWTIVWLGTSLAGGVFGCGVGFLSIMTSGSVEALGVPLFGMLIGVIWAGIVGLLVISTFAFIVWCFWLQEHPGILAACAGALTGFVCAPFIFFFTSPLGAAGAYLAVKQFCRVKRNNMSCQSERRVFSIQDLFWRMTGFAVILTMWLTVIRWFWPSL